MFSMSPRYHANTPDEHAYMYVTLFIKGRSVCNEPETQYPTPIASLPHSWALEVDSEYMSTDLSHGTDM